MSADTTEVQDYKDTLNLPRTEFPMRAGLPQREPEWLARWEKIGVYDRLRDKARATARQPFTLHDGPPYANGHLHIGHALNKILKDMVVRSQQMMGRDARYIPGWDCHGLPIEWKIEEQYRAKGLDKDDVPVVDFRQECRKFAEGWVDIQREEFKRLGITGTWDKPYLTMDFHAEAVIAAEFQKFLMTSTLYQGSKPVMWSPVEKTALAEAEIEYHEHKSHTIWVPFKVVDFSGFSDEFIENSSLEKFSEAQNSAKELIGANVVIWTTTPWTIPSNRAVAFNAKISYGVYEVTAKPKECWVEIGDRYIIADNLAEEVLTKARLEPSMYRRLSSVNKDVLAGLKLSHPFRGLSGSEFEWQRYSSIGAFEVAFGFREDLRP
ncbi:MAG: class I tRNA ligase family protein, partial [Rhodobacterales bacterium]|nr:class I tRNA ligase family protein [Rhodobacterales bacterium]MDX5412086.1 class I tRNA ligase family protein [Rhodobacterales bacterium]